MRPVALTLAALLLLTVGAPAALAANHEVLMLNKGETGTMVFEPALLEIAVGDTVTFVPTDKGHNAGTIKGMLPEGAEPFKGKMSAEVSVTFDTPGAYGIKCAPHLGMGMVALVVVGDVPGNLDDAMAVKHPKVAKERFDAMFAALGAE